MSVGKAGMFASLEARERHVPRGLANTHGIFVDHLDSTRPRAVAGTEYPALTRGLAVLDPDHRHPPVRRPRPHPLERPTTPQFTPTLC